MATTKLARRRFRFACGIAFAALLLPAGCDKGPPPPQCEVTGVVKVGGRPTGDVCIRFFSISDPARKHIPDATWSAADGTYALKVQNPGDYVVTLFWPTITVVDGERLEGEDRFAGRHNNLNAPVVKTTLNAGSNVVPINL